MKKSYQKKYFSKNIIINLQETTIILQLFFNQKKLIEVNRMLNKHNIFPRRYFYPSINKLKYIKNSKRFKNSESLSDRILCLPNYYYELKHKEQMKIINLINSIATNGLNNAQG